MRHAEKDLFSGQHILQGAEAVVDDSQQRSEQKEQQRFARTSVAGPPASQRPAAFYVSLAFFS